MELTDGEARAEEKSTFLDAIEARVLGVLIEKEKTTPDYYPMTLNQIRTACNQKTSRNPVVSFDESTVVRGLDQLQRKKLAGTVTGMSSRVPKYRHNTGIFFDLAEEEVAVVCVLLLRGIQTAGEIKSSTGRIHSFESLEDTDRVIQRLMDREEPLVAEVPRRPGQKESRYTQLLSEVPDTMEAAEPSWEPATLAYRDESERIEKLENELLALRAEFEKFKKQFE